MHCCPTDGDHVPPPTPPGLEPRQSWRRRITTLIHLALPLTTLALIPKCPACLAAYILLFTGIGLSVPAATAVRWAMLALSIAVLAVLVLRAARSHLLPRTVRD